MNWALPEIQTCPVCGKALGFQVCAYATPVGLEPPDIVRIDCDCGARWERGQGWTKEASR